LDILLQRLPSEKLIDYDMFPLSYEIGFIHIIPESELDMAQATITLTDVGFLGLFPKRILQELRAYAREMERLNESNDEFLKLTNQLITNFI
jgi:hypothetical protein